MHCSYIITIGRTRSADNLAGSVRQLIMFVAPAACRVAMQQPRAARLQSVKEFFYIVRGEAGLTAFEVSQLISDETTEDPYGWHQLSLTKVFALFHSPADWIMLNSTGRGMIAYKYHPMFVVTVNGLDYCVLRHCHNRDPVVIRRVPLAPMVLNMHPQFSRYQWRCGLRV